MISKVSAIVGGILGALFGIGLFGLVSVVYFLPQARNEGREMERAKLDAATNKAIGELSDAADKARFTRRLCRERGLLYLNATGQCEQRAVEPNG